MLLQSVLLGKAREIFSQLTVEDSGEYDTVKQLILKGYVLVPEAYRQKFRVLCKSSNKTLSNLRKKRLSFSIAGARQKMWRISTVVYAS